MKTEVKQGKDITYASITVSHWKYVFIDHPSCERGLTTRWLETASKIVKVNGKVPILQIISTYTAQKWCVDS